MYLGQGYKPISIKSLLKVNNQSNKKGATYAPVPSAEEFASEIGLTALENVLQVKDLLYNFLFCWDSYPSYVLYTKINEKLKGKTLKISLLTGSSIFIWRQSNSS